MYHIYSSWQFLEELFSEADEKLVGTIGIGYDFTANCASKLSCIMDNVSLKVTTLVDGFEISWIANSTAATFTDCFDLKKGELNWYGGPQRWAQHWPVEKLNISGDEAYVIKRSDNFAVAERYWLNSAGGYIFLDDRVPLFVDQNNKEDGKVCFIANSSGPYINRSRVSLSIWH